MRAVDPDREMPAKAAGCEGIATQMFDSPPGGGSGVMPGGGRSNFLPDRVADPKPPTSPKPGPKPDPMPGPMAATGRISLGR